MAFTEILKDLDPLFTSETYTGCTASAPLTKIISHVTVGRSTSCLRPAKYLFPIVHSFIQCMLSMPLDFDNTTNTLTPMEPDADWPNWENLTDMDPTNTTG